MKRWKLSDPEQTIQDTMTTKRRHRVTVLTCWDEHFYHVLFLYTYSHIGGRLVLLSFLQREKIWQRYFTELSVHFSVKKKKKKTSTWLWIHLLFSRVRFFEETTIVLPISNGF